MGFLTLPGIVVIALILFVGAYFESLLRPLRKRGRWKVSSGIGLGLIGALGGVTLVGLAWVLGSSTPTIASLIICGLLGAVGTVASVWPLPASDCAPVCARSPGRRAGEMRRELLGLSRAWVSYFDLKNPVQARTPFTMRDL